MSHITTALCSTVVSSSVNCYSSTNTVW